MCHSCHAGLTVAARWHVCCVCLFWGLRLWLWTYVVYVVSFKLRRLPHTILLYIDNLCKLVNIYSLKMNI